MTDDLRSFQGVIRTLKDRIKSPFSTCQVPETMSDEKLQSVVKKQNHLASGSRSSLLQRIRDIPDTGKVNLAHVCMGVGLSFCAAI